MMDFKGTWRCREGAVAEISEFKPPTEKGGDGFWVGAIVKEPKFLMTTGYARWDEAGESIDFDKGMDLMERISESWSKKERSGGE